MSDTIAVTGIVATDPRHITTNEGLEITSFRLASTQRRFNRSQNAWVDGETNWYTITVFRQLASNAAVSLKKGERVVVNGRLRIREWISGEKSGTTVEVEADSIGHDLLFGTTTFSRTVTSTTTTEKPAPEEFPTEESLVVPDTAVTAETVDEERLTPAGQLATPF